MNTLPEKIIYIRNTFDDTQENFASKLDISRSKLSKIESGTSLPSLEELSILKDKFNVSIDALLDEAVGCSQIFVSATEIKEIEPRYLSENIFHGMSPYEKILFFLKKKQYIIEDLAMYLGLKTRGISRWRMHGIPDKHIPKICEFLKIPPEYLLDDNTEYLESREVLSPEEKKLIDMYRQLNEKNKVKVEGIVENKLNEQNA